MQGELVGVALALRPGQAAYIPLAHRAADELDLGGEEGPRIQMREALDLLKPLLEDPAVLKIVQNAKFDMVVLARYGIALKASTIPASCPMRSTQAAPSICPSSLPARCSPIPASPTRRSWAQAAPPSPSTACPSRAPRNLPARRPISACGSGSCSSRGLPPSTSTTVYETLERPIAPVLALMERTGIRVERATLSSLSGSFAQSLARLEDEIRELAGEDFNIGSPKQLGEILFDKMSLPGGRRTKTGAWSTDASALEELAAEGHDLPRKVLDWRLLAKLKSTYTDALPTYIHPETGPRAHLLRARRHHHRPALIARAEFAEHPGAHQ